MTAARRIAAALACVLAVGGLCALAMSQQTAPHQTGSGGGEAEPDPVDTRFEHVDWDMWADANPDVIGWVQVQGTEISLPVCAAPDDDPGFYLEHDAEGNWSAWGCPYLASYCDGGLLGSANAVVSGHHMNDGSMFSELARATEDGWIDSHREIYLQTREHRCVYEIEAASRIDASETGPQTRFAGTADLAAYMGSCTEKAETSRGVLDSDRMLTLVTCSYGIWRNQRTVVHAKPVEVDGLACTGGAESLLGPTDCAAAEQAARAEAYEAARKRWESFQSS